MNNRSWPRLLLIAWLALGIQSASAQKIPVKESHHALPDEPDMKAGPEMMAERLKELHELHQLQDQMQDLLKDPDFQKNLTQNFSEEQLQQLREKILKGDGLGRDADWNKLLDQVVSRHKLDERQIDILRRWAERSDGNPRMPPVELGSLPGRPPSVSPPFPSTASGSSGPDASLMNAEPSFWSRLQGETSDWITNHLDGFAGDVFDAMEELGATEEGAPLAELMRSVNRSDFTGGGFTEEAAGLSNSLPDLSEFRPERGGFWDELGSVFREMDGPSLGSGPSVPSLPAVPSGDGDAWGGGLVALLSLGIMLVLLWKMGGWSRWKTTRGEAETWRLGSWPVSPAGVSTRRDLVRAFEYLALLRLGADASTHHHRELAKRLAEQGEGEPTRRQAAELLASFYEQARYAPADESLSQDELTDARHALCFLAGVTTA
jgi:hypothetical protein